MIFCVIDSVSFTVPSEIPGFTAEPSFTSGAASKCQFFFTSRGSVRSPGKRKAPEFSDIALRGR